MYRGRLAPSPTGLLHQGHARTFAIAQDRARQHQGVLILRVEDLDADRCRADFYDAMLEDLRWLGLTWQEGPDRGGPFGPYRQRDRSHFYREAFRRLREGGWLYPCTCSRRDVQRALRAPHSGDDEPIYPGTCRVDGPSAATPAKNGNVNWRFRTPIGEKIVFTDGNLGPQQFVSGEDFGDFVVWRHDQLPSYQLAVVVDDHAMQITEVVRGADLLVSTARQILLYRALGHHVPEFFHCPLVVDAHGKRLAKRHDSLSVRRLREQGRTPESVRAPGAGIRSPEE